MTRKKNGMVGAHDGHVRTHVWFTPPEIVQSLGNFDLDPASCSYRPYDTAQNHYEVETQNGLELPFFGRVWLNPPYDSHTIDAWMQRMAEHDNGIALTFGRTDRNTFHRFVFPVADSMFFIKQRLHFYNEQGERAKSNAGAPSVLIAYGEENSESLRNVCVKGHHVPLIQRVAVVVVGLDRSWRVLVQTVLVRPMSVDEVVENIRLMAPEKMNRNRHYREKIRQQLQLHFTRVGRGVYSKMA